MRRLLCLALLFLGVAASLAAVPGYPPTWIPIFKGIWRTSETNTPGVTSTQYKLQVIKVDLQDPDVRIFTTPPITNNYVAGSQETLSQKPGEFLRANRLKVAVNGAHFDPSSYNLPSGYPQWIYGMAISQGVQVSPYDGAGEADAYMYLTTNKVPSFNYSPSGDIYTAIPGIYPLVTDGVYAYPSTSGAFNLRQPRTAIGYSEDGRYFVMLVIDGREPGENAGAYNNETAEWLIYYGVYYGMNLDGGGSTCMVMANAIGEPVELNENSYQRAVGRPGDQRSVGHNIGFYALEFLQNAKVTPGRTTAVLTWDTTTPTSTRMEYGATSTLGAYYTALDQTPRTNHTVILTGLVPAATNYFRLIAVVNNVEFSSAVSTFATLPVGTAMLFDLTNTWSYTTNNLDGVPWTAPAYNEADWMGSGPGLLYVEDSGYVYPKNTPLPSVVTAGVPPVSGSGLRIPITYYFRAHFQFPSLVNNVSLTFSNLIDDGAVFYLNGAEIYRLRMPGAPQTILNTTLANSAPGYGQYQAGDYRYGDAAADNPTVFTLAGAIVTNNLRQGDNVMAVEVHNYNAGSPDIVFGNALFYNVAQAGNVLVVASDPVLNVPVTVTPNDNYGDGGGSTPIERLFNANATATVTAPITFGDKSFMRWLKDGVVFATTPTVNVTMDTTHALIAVYGIFTSTLTVATINPGSGVPITITPADNAGNSNGQTPLTRNYNTNTTVTLTAPAVAGANYFIKWQRNGVDFSTNSTISMGMNTNYALTAVYAAPLRTLTIQSQNPATGVTIAVTPNDNNGNGGGAAPLARSYTNGAVVTLTAPAFAGANYFLKWLKNGTDYSTNMTTVVTVDTNHVLSAVYATPLRTLTIQSQNPAIGVTIAVTPNDNNGNGGGAAPLARSYINGTVVTLTAPAFAGANYFLKWLMDGTDYSTNMTIVVDMDTSHVMTAAYATPQWMLSVGANPETGVAIDVVPGGVNTNTVTPFNSTYLHLTQVTLTAPATANENVFQHWRLDGADFSTNRTIQLSMVTNHALVAVYAPVTFTLTVTSTNPADGVVIEVLPEDQNRHGNGPTPLERVYTNRSLVTLTAPASVGTNQFEKWLRGGADLSTNQTIAVLMDTNQMLMVVYVSPAPSLPPQLTIQNAGNYIILNWQNSGYQLQSTTNLLTLNWTNVPGPITNGPYTNLIHLTDPAQLFRLKQ